MMPTTDNARFEDDRAPKGMFTAVVVVEILVLVSLWFIGRHFS